MDDGEGRKKGNYRFNFIVKSGAIVSNLRPRAGANFTLFSSSFFFLFFLFFLSTVFIAKLFAVELRKRIAAEIQRRVGGTRSRREAGSILYGARAAVGGIISRRLLCGRRTATSPCTVSPAKHEYPICILHTKRPAYPLRGARSRSESDVDASKFLCVLCI